MRTPTLRALFWLMLSVCSISALAQTKKTIAGTVKDASGNVLSGVTFTVKGTKIAGATDNQGNFRVTLPTQNAVLVFTSVGYERTEITVGNDNFVTVGLLADGKSLNEVVVTGFGVRKNVKKLAYAIQEVKGDELVRAGTVNVVNSLQGKVAGVMVNQGAGGPSSSSRIRIRGNSNISTTSNIGSMPLFVIDGVLLQPGTSGADSWGDNRDFGNQLKNLNPDDYESLTVLKGSAASALYGSQAINGVILITTKKGRVRPGLGVTVNQQNTWNSVYKLPDFQNEYGGGNSTTFTKNAAGQNIIPNDGYAPYYSFGPKFDGSQIIDADGITRAYKANNMKELYQTGFLNSTNVALEGGNDRTTIRFSYTKVNQSGIVSTNKFSRDNFNLRATQKLGNFLSLDASISYAVSNSKNPMQQGGQGSLLYRLAYSNARSFPIDNLFAGYINQTAGGRTQGPSPYLRGSVTDDMWTIYQTDVSQKEDNLLANLDITANITPWLSLLVRSNVNSIGIVNEKKERGDGPGFNSATYGTYSLYTSSYKTGRIQALLTATKKFGEDFDLSVTAGGETYRGLGGSQLSNSTAGGFKLPDIYALSNSKNAVTTNTDQSGKYPQYRLDALYAYGDVTWKNMLTLTASFRNDWDSRLTYPNGSGNYTYYYPSVGVSWIFTEMLKNSPQYKFLSYGKLRASFGITGASTQTYVTSTGNYQLNGTFTNASGAAVPRYGFQSNDLGNLDLKPLRATEYELGADLRFMDNRIRLDAAVYKKNTRNEIISLGAPAESGISSRVINAGNTQNKGVEILLSGTIVRKKNIEWTTSFNFSLNRNRIITLAPGVSSVDLDLAFGNDVRAVAAPGLEFGTIVSTYAYAHDPKSGAKLLQQDGTYWRSGSYFGNSILGEGLVNLGSAMENYLLSNINEFRYKNFSLFVQVDSKVGGKIASTTHQYGSEYGNYKSTLFGRDTEHGGVTYTDASGATRTDGIIPDGVFSAGVKFNGVDYGGKTYADAVAAGVLKPKAALDYYEGIASWGTGIREYSVFDNTWVALREVSLGYEFSKAIASKIHFQRLNLSLVGRNILYLYTSTKDHIYPEAIYSSKPGAFAETGGGPYQRQLGVSLKAGF